MEFPFKKHIRSIEEMELIAGELAEEFHEGNIVLLTGNLGTGKTTLTKLICQKFGISNANSPSFSIVNEYTGKIKVYHFDFYRIKKVEELYDIGLEDYLNDDSALIFIEWANLFPEITPKKYYEISLHFSENEGRMVTILDNNK